MMAQSEGHQEGHHREGRPGGGDQVGRRPGGASQEDPGGIHQRYEAAPEAVQVLEPQGECDMNLYVEFPTLNIFDKG